MVCCTGDRIAGGSDVEVTRVVSVTVALLHVVEVTKVVIVVSPNRLVTTTGVVAESAGQLHSVEFACPG